MVAVRAHLYPYRTQKLSSQTPIILNGRLFEKVGSCHLQYGRLCLPFFLLCTLFEFLHTMNYTKEKRNKLTKHFYIRNSFKEEMAMFGNMFGGRGGCGCGNDCGNNCGCGDCTWIIILILILCNCGCKIDPCFLIIILLLLCGCGCNDRKDFNC